MPNKPTHPIKQSLSSLLLLVFLTALSIYSTAETGNKVPFRDTTLTDLTGKYWVTIPVIPTALMDNIQSFSVAVIPTDSLGMKKIGWSETKEQLTQETEKEFETELLRCRNGKDKNGNAHATTVKRKLYCERVGYGEGAMGSFYEIHYYGFVKNKKLVIIEIVARFTNCLNYEASEIPNCKAREAKARTNLIRMMEKIVLKIQLQYS